ncbi:MAG TPA: NUDIX hydrolase [Nitrososphaeraceae archaeon]|nr:NUDIX hydrolase [Nitrososphaeraceae archaeon]
MKKYRNPIPTVDAIIQKSSFLLLIKRQNDPYKDTFALPGGFVDEGETVEEALVREVFEETSLEIHPVEILGVYSTPTRDPRGHMMTVVFITITYGGELSAGDDAKELHWIPLDNINNIDLAFDHKLIIKDYINWRNSGGTFWSTKTR